MKTIAIANQKGGTGKTTTTYNLGIALTQQGYRVLMVDFDPQGNLSCYCGIPPEKDLDQTITELLMKTSCEKPIGNRECVYQTGRKEAAARVDFIPSNLRLAGFELAMGTMMCREVLLKSCLEQYNNQYDYCLIDCSPSVGLLLTNALATANEIIIPMQAQPFSVVGMSQLTSSIANVQRNLTHQELHACRTQVVFLVLAHQRLNPCTGLAFITAAYSQMQLVLRFNRIAYCRVAGLYLQVAVEYRTGILRALLILIDTAYLAVSFIYPIKTSVPAAYGNVIAKLKMLGQKAATVFIAPQNAFKHLWVFLLGPNKVKLHAAFTEAKVLQTAARKIFSGYILEYEPLHLIYFVRILLVRKILFLQAVG